MWLEPKTDWYGRVNDSGEYEGDRFNKDDYNRIKNNLIYLRDIAIEVWEEFDIKYVSEDKNYSDYFYADEINRLEDNLETISSKTIQKDYGQAPIYSDNSPTMDFNELNRLESAILDLYDRINNAYEGRRMFTWNFGMKGDF